jgi:hypothetical protein
MLIGMAFLGVFRVFSFGNVRRVSGFIETQPDTILLPERNWGYTRPTVSRLWRTSSRICRLVSIASAE